MIPFVLLAALAAPPDAGPAPKTDPAFERELQADREMGSKYVAEYDKQYPPTKDEAAAARVRRIGERLALVANTVPVKALWGDSRHATFDYTFRTVGSSDVNAFSLPGGYIYVFDGLVKFTESDDELAGVLAHEISHAEQRHVATLQREQKRLERISIPLILAAILTGGAAAGTIAGGTQLISQGIASGWSQKAETSADWGGFEYLRRSDYNSTGMLTFMERLRLQEFNNTQGLDLGIYRTHPPTLLRAERIAGYMEAAGIAPQRSVVTRSFRTTARAADDGSMRILFGGKPLFVLSGADAKARSEAAVRRLNSFFDSVPRVYQVKVSGNGEITGASRTLVSLTPADAAAMGKPLPAASEAAAGAIRSALVNLAFNLWEGR